MREKPMYMVQEELREAHAELSGKDGRDLREQTAKILCLNGLTRIGVSQKTSDGIRKALSETSMQRQMRKIMETPAFRKLAALPNDELRALAAESSGRALGDQFIRELAKQDLAAAPAANRPQQPVQQPLQANGEQERIP